MPGSSTIRIGPNRPTLFAGQMSKKTTRPVFCTFLHVLARARFYCVCFLCFRYMCYSVSLFSVGSTSANDCLERLVSEMTCHVSSRCQTLLTRLNS